MSTMRTAAATGVHHPHPPFKRRWILIVAIGETVGFGVPAVVGALTAGAAFDRWQVLLVLAGLGEGALLGAAQVLAARPYARRPRALPWIVATALGAAIAWACGLGTSTLGHAGTLPLPGFIAVAIVLVAVGLVAMPTLQLASMRAKPPAAALWIPVNAGAWVVGVGWTLLPSPFIDESTPASVLIVAYVLAGLFMAVTVAALTAPFARRLFTGAPASESPTPGSADDREC